jgi:GNAT superfamily N-acetyltransferase
MPLTFEPLNPGRWADLETLFGPRGACGGCWCMYWRLGRADFEASKGAGNQRAFKRIVSRGVEPGILAYEAETPIGWCALGPRESFAKLGRSRVLAPVDASPVWSVVCFFVARPYRRRGLTVELLREAARHALRQGARILEGYPIEPSRRRLAEAFAWTGLASAFRKAGFSEVARRSPTRPIMRLELRS